MRIAILSSAALLLAGPVFAQSTPVSKKFSFGFSAGLNYAWLHPNWFDRAVVKKIELDRSTGFELGLLASYRATKNISLRTRPSLVFNATSVTVERIDNTQQKYLVQPSVEIPLHVVYMVNTKTIKPYVLAGARYRIPVALDNAQALSLPRYSLDVGIGAARVFPYFRFAPELLYSYGLTSAGDVADVKNVAMNTISLVFNFAK